MLKGIGSQRLVALFFAGCMLLNFPLLSLWNTGVTLFGVPLFAVGLFCLWALLIATLAWLLEHSED